MEAIQLIEQLKRINAISELGLLYANNQYDIERFEELKAISLTLFSLISGEHIEKVKVFFPKEKEYPTVMVDVRAMILSADNKVLLVKEKLDDCWSLPGGWADVGFSPREIIAKEVKEETGLHIVPTRVLAIFDKKMHPHPCQPYYVYKMVFHCEPTTFALQEGFDILGVQYFDIMALPELSQDRILKNQILLCHEKLVSNDHTTYFD
jgi:ADP-ribose pyrophosphatase YjhB (NUDIX family)